MSNVEPERLAEVFVEVADTLVEEFDLVEFLHMLTAHTSSLVGARAAGLLLADRSGTLQFMAASDERAEMLELFQLQALQGPSQDAFRDAAVVVTEDLTKAQERWPAFVPLALSAGYRSTHAFPMRLRGTVIGALNLFDTEASTLAEPEVRIVQALAAVATIGLLQERMIRQGEVLSEQLQGALDTRIVIEQAKGALAQIHGGTPDEGFVILRDYARNQRRKLTDVAHAVINDPATVPELTRPATQR